MLGIGYTHGMKYKQNTVATGFTLVELLIAVVVIAILAAISVVAYNNIQNRAYATDLLSRADAYEKALKLYHIENGRFPQYGDSWGTCLGEISDYPAENGYPEGACMRSTHYQPDIVNENIMNQLKTVINPVPSGKTRESTETYTAPNGTKYQRWQRGFYYEHQNNSPSSSGDYPDWAYIEYLFDGQGACPKDFSSRYNDDTNTTFCSRLIEAQDKGVD